MTKFDIPPPGYDHVTPVQYKAMQAAGTIPMDTPIINTTQLNATGTGMKRYQREREGKGGRRKGKVRERGVEGGGREIERSENGDDFRRIEARSVCLVL